MTMSYYLKTIHTSPLNSFRVTTTMEYRPNSGPEKRTAMPHHLRRPSGSEDIGPDDDSHNFALTEYLTIHNATNICEGPRRPAYNSKAARLRSYTDWPHGMNPSPDSLSTAGFYFSVRN